MDAVFCKVLLGAFGYIVRCNYTEFYMGLMIFSLVEVPEDTELSSFKACSNFLKIIIILNHYSYSFGEMAAHRRWCYYREFLSHPRKISSYRESNH